MSVSSLSGRAAPGAILLLILSCGEHIASANGVLIQTHSQEMVTRAPGELN